MDIVPRDRYPELEPVTHAFLDGAIDAAWRIAAIMVERDREIGIDSVESTAKHLGNLSSPDLNELIQSMSCALIWAAADLMMCSEDH